jgi:hypothetical protein
MARRRTNPLKLKAIVYSNPDNDSLSVFTMNTQGNLAHPNPVVFRKSTAAHVETSGVEAPQITSDHTESALWSTPFDEDLSRGVLLNDFLDVMTARGGLRPIP